MDVDFILSESFLRVSLFCTVFYDVIFTSVVVSVSVFVPWASPGSESLWFFLVFFRVSVSWSFRITPYFSCCFLGRYSRFYSECKCFLLCVLCLCASLGQHDLLYALLCCIYIGLPGMVCIYRCVLFALHFTMCLGPRASFHVSLCWFPASPVGSFCRFWSRPTWLQCLSRVLFVCSAGCSVCL